MQRNKADSGIRVGAAVDPGEPQVGSEADMCPVCQCPFALRAIQELGT